jgi:hypothetical protein
MLYENVALATGSVAESLRQTCVALLIQFLHLQEVDHAGRTLFFPAAKNRFRVASMSQETPPGTIIDNIANVRYLQQYFFKNEKLGLPQVHVQIRMLFKSALITAKSHIILNLLQQQLVSHAILPGDLHFAAGSVLNSTACEADVRKQQKT